MLQLKNTDQNGFSAPIENKRVAQRLDRITNDYDLLSYVKHNISFFLDSGLVDAEWFSRFDPDTLKELNIYTSGWSGIEVKEKDLNALVIDCKVDIKTYNDALVNVRFFGKSYGMIFLNCKSSANIKVAGTTTIEVYASDHSLATIGLNCKSSIVLEAHKSSFVALRNRSRGYVQIDKGEPNIVIN